MPASCRQPAMAAGKGFLYLAGGYSEAQEAVAEASRYSVGRGAWQPLPPMPTARAKGAAACLAGELVVLGGRDGGTAFGEALACVEKFNPMTWLWEELPPLQFPRWDCSAAAFQDGICALGGVDSGYRALDVVDVLDVDVARTPWTLWRSLPPLGHKRSSCAVAVLGQNLYALGGVDGNSLVESCEVLGSGSAAWAPLRQMVDPRRHFAATRCSKHLYVFGGMSYGGKCVKTVESFDPETQRWSQEPPLEDHRCGIFAFACWS